MELATLDWFWFWFGLLIIANLVARAIAASSSVRTYRDHHTRIDLILNLI